MSNSTPEYSSLVDSDHRHEMSDDRRIGARRAPDIGPFGIGVDCEAAHLARTAPAVSSGGGACA
jgi:hypothetical protein